MKFQDFLDGVEQGLAVSLFFCILAILAFIHDGGIHIGDASLPIEAALAFYIFSGVVAGGIAGACRPFFTSYIRATVVGVGAAVPVFAVAWAGVGIYDGFGDYITFVALLSLPVGATGGCAFYSAKLRYRNRQTKNKSIIDT